MQKFNRFNIYDIFMKDKHTKTMGVILIMLVAVLYVLCIEYIFPARVTVVYATMQGTETKTKETRADNVLGAVADTGVTIHTSDAVTPCREHELKNGMKIKVLKAVKTSAVIAGEKKVFNLYPGTVEDNLRYNKIKYDKDDIVTPSLDTQVTADTSIEVKELHTVTKEKESVIEASTESILDPTLASGQVVTSDGKDGSAVCDFTTTYINGVEQGTERTVKKWIEKPQNAGIRFGTKSTGQSGSVSYSRTFTGNTTAYYMGESAYGAAGGHCVYGTCAVDPSVIPYGTKLYITGYGYAVANDCGSAVKGNVVDLYMHNNSECSSWGRRYVKVYVLS